MEAYPLQKTAYRHANGGSGAPGVHDDVPPKFMTPMGNDLEDLKGRLEMLKEPRLVVKNTFLDVEEEGKVSPIKFVARSRRCDHPDGPRPQLSGSPCWLTEPEIRHCKAVK